MTAGEVWFDNLDPSLRRCWHPVARADDLVGAGPLEVVLLGESWVVARLEGGLAALRDTCPHRLAPLSAGSVVDGTLQCAYHGYRFAGDGRCVDIPALGGTVPIPARADCGAAYGVVEHLGLIWIAPEEPVVGLPEVPEHTDPDFVHCPLPVVDWNASAAQMTDNFLDLGHLAFLHLETFGEAEDAVVGDYDVVRDGLSFSVRYRHLAKALADSFGAADPRTVERESYWVYTPPHHIRLRLSYPDEGAVLSINFCHQPVDATTTRLYVTDYRNDIPDEPDAVAEAVAFQLAVAMEDKALLERLRVKAVPLGQTTEFHSRADRITLEMRRVLRELVELTSPTATTSVDERSTAVTPTEEPT